MVAENGQNENFGFGFRIDSFSAISGKAPHSSNCIPSCGAAFASLTPITLDVCRSFL